MPNRSGRVEIILYREWIWCKGFQRQVDLVIAIGIRIIFPRPRITSNHCGGVYTKHLHVVWLGCVDGTMTEQGLDSDRVSRVFEHNRAEASELDLTDSNRNQRRG